jgi:hypothetical protein
MAKISSGILGQVKGKVANVVAATWKGTNYVRARVIPANPNSEAQQAQRNLMATIVLYGKQVLTSIIQVLWNPLSTKKSGWNLYTKKNLDSMSSATDFANMKFSDGSLEGATVASADYDDGTDQVQITWDETVVANGLLTDKAVALVIDSDTGIVYSSVGSVTRDDEVVDISVPDGRTAASLHAYLFFYNATSYLMSQTAYGSVSEA